MFYGRPDSDDALLQQGLTNTDITGDKLTEKEQGLIPQSSHIQVVLPNNDDKESKANQGRLIPELGDISSEVFDNDKEIDMESPRARKLIMEQSFIIPQLDGFDEELSSEDETIENKKIFAINCEDKEIVQLINFFRSFDVLWERV